jgi:alpha-ketoglutarate-dependent taurine dioxygenase
MSITTTSLHPVIGERVEGLDLSEPLTPDAVANLKQILHERQLLVFPRQPLSQDQFLAFSRTFGEPEFYTLRGYGGVPSDKGADEPVPLVQRLTNLNADNVPYGPCPQMDRMAIAENWHSDSSYRAVPSYVTLLNAVETPTVGGDTHFTSTHAAYDAIPKSLRDQIENYHVRHNWEYQRTRAPGMEPITEDERASVPPVIHKLVQRHPATGRKLLYLSSGAETILELPYEDGQNLIKELTEIATAPERVYTHKWGPNDLVMWDNRATLHRAGVFDYRSTVLRRLLHRVVIAGDAAAYEQPQATPSLARAST